MAFDVSPVSPSVALVDGLSLPFPADGTDVLFVLIRSPFCFEYSFSDKMGYSTKHANASQSRRFRDISI
jgi:hypothetical protein